MTKKLGNKLIKNIKEIVKTIEFEYGSQNTRVEVYENFDNSGNSKGFDCYMFKLKKGKRKRKSIWE